MVQKGIKKNTYHIHTQYMKNIKINNISQKGRKGQGEEVCFEPRFKNGDGRSVSN